MRSGRFPPEKRRTAAKSCQTSQRRYWIRRQKKNIAKEDVAGVGIGVPGPVDGKGVVHRAVNLGWDVMNINETLGGLLGMPVKAGNDANVAALGEMWCGGGKGIPIWCLQHLAQASAAASLSMVRW